MMGQKTLLLLLSLLAVLEMASALGFYYGRSMPGSPYNISRTDPRIQKVVLDATFTFNNQSNDAYLFKPYAIYRAQRQTFRCHLEVWVIPWRKESITQVFFCQS
ncbi:cystatin-F [Xyrichtys novacula]|uniref:Cystatin-F n=1 Tax=Xyrichtys novacula TaxID=13765 RepID=A0AAV1F9A4_XYRNO|nr:cystatin-F [Xyrichtys novacula]